MTQELMQRLGIQSPETAEKVEQFLLALEERNRLLTEKCGTGKRKNTGRRSPAEREKNRGYGKSHFGSRRQECQSHSGAH